MIGLVDANNFYVSCQRSFDPSLCGRAVVVLSNNDGCVIARSNEAKAIGIKMGVPYFQLADVQTQHDLRIFSSNYTLSAFMWNIKELITVVYLAAWIVGRGIRSTNEAGP